MLPRDSKDGWKVLEILLDGGKEEAVSLLEVCRDCGLARAANANRAIGYLRNNLPIIRAEEPSVGTMESENQHVYSARFEAVPCARPRQDISDAARIRSQMHSGRQIPRRPLADSVTPKRRARREQTEIEHYAKKNDKDVMAKSVGSGHLPTQARVSGPAADIRYVVGVDRGMMKLQG